MYVGLARVYREQARGRWAVSDNLANPAGQPAGPPKFLVQIAQCLLVVLYRDFRRVNPLQEVHEFVRIDLSSILIHEILLDSLDFQLALQRRKRLLVLGEFVAGSRESGFPIRCGLCGLARLLG